MPHPFETILSANRAGYRQKHPCTCGPASLALGAHALGLPLLEEGEWLSPRLSRWMPTSEFTVRGMALHEAQFTTEIIFAGKIEVILRRAYPHQHDQFLKDLEEAKNSENTAMVINFLQDFLIGEKSEYPHFSLLAGVDMSTKMLTISDVDPEIEAIYTASTEDAFQSMAFLNQTFKLPRGWLLLRKI